MLVISILFSAIAVSLISTKLTSIHFSRCTTLIILICLLLTPSITFDISTINLYHSLFFTSLYQIIIDNVLFSVIILILLCINPILTQAYNNRNIVLAITITDNEKEDIKTINFIIKPELGIIIIFMVLGSTILLSSLDLISIYLTLELQSFALYLIASIRTDLISSTGAGLKYFLLGAISSSFIILGISFIYQVLGTTNLQTLTSFIINVYNISDSSNVMGLQTINLGLLLIFSGLIFKISAAPFHNWFADVIQDVPTYIGIIIINIPKISVLSILFYVCQLIFVSKYDINTLNLTPCFLFIIIIIIFSLILGTVAGLVQSKVKRLIAFSTISHVGFILIAFLSFYTIDNSNVLGLESLVFYLFQYLVTILLTLIIFTAFETSSFKRSINNISDLIGIYKVNPVLTFTLILCLFSIAGIPPLTGFFAKYNVLKCSLLSSSYFLSFLAITCSLISASYYIRLIKLIVFINPTEQNINELNGEINPVIAYAITILMLIITLYIFDTTLIINSIELMALSFFDLGS